MSRQDSEIVPSAHLRVRRDRSPFTKDKFSSNFSQWAFVKELPMEVNIALRSRTPV